LAVLSGTWRHSIHRPKHCGVRPVGNAMLTSTCTPQGISQNEVVTMVWTAPVFEEVSLCCEINSYVSAKL
jgi:coenzyme PQQ precursor peptide PqqA